MPHFRNNHRTVCRVGWRTKGPDGGYVATFRIAPSDNSGRTREALREYVESHVLSRPGILKAQLWEAEEAATGIPTGDKALRDHPDRHSKWALILSGIDLPSVKVAVEADLGADAWSRLGIASEIELGYYVLQAGLEKEHLAPVT